MAHRWIIVRPRMHPVEQSAAYRLPSRLRRPSLASPYLLLLLLLPRCARRVQEEKSVCNQCNQRSKQAIGCLFPPFQRHPRHLWLPALVFLGLAHRLVWNPVPWWLFDGHCAPDAETQHQNLHSTEHKPSSLQTLVRCRSRLRGPAHPSLRNNAMRSR